MSRYMGKEIINTKYGKFHAIKIKPLLIQGSMFVTGEKMTVWVSDDPNHIPLRVQASNPDRQCKSRPDGI